MSSSYEKISYASYPRHECHVTRLATVSSLFGLPAKHVESCRVLELGCGAGGNLIPMAEQLPGSRFVGLDLSESAIEHGQRILRDLDLANIELKHQGILGFKKDLGQFDYIICHGVFSWVPSDVRDRILKICERHLTPDGVAYISYNTLPGWRERSALRDMMLFHTRDIEEPAEQLQQSRALLEFLSAGRTGRSEPFDLVLKRAQEEFKSAPSYYLFHEYLADVNQAFYFHEFMQMAERCGLQYLAEAQIPLMSMADLSDGTRGALGELAGERQRLEQYLDFLRNRTLRETLLCKKGRAVRFPLEAESLAGYRLASRLQSGGASDAFELAGGQVETQDALTNACLRLLGEAWPGRIPFDELERAGRERSPGCATSRRQLLSNMLACLEGNLIEVELYEANYDAVVPEYPRASRLARYQALRQESVTTLRHQHVRLEPISRQVLSLLDGTRDRAALLGALMDLVEKGDLRMESGGRVLSGASARGELSSLLGRALDQLAKHAFMLRAN